MDGKRFDEAVKAFASGFTRRGIGRVLAGGLGTGLLRSSGAVAGRKRHGADAGKNHGSKGRGKRRDSRPTVRAESNGTTTVSVDATQPWTDTGIDLTQNVRVDITASGRIRIAGSDPGKFPDGTTFEGDTPATECDAGAVTQNAACWSLIGRVAGGDPFPVGFGTSFTTTAGGRLELGVNDGRSSFGDNSGSWTATVTIFSDDLTVKLIDDFPFERSVIKNQQVKAIRAYLCQKEPFSCSDPDFCCAADGDTLEVSNEGARIRKVRVLEHYQSGSPQWVAVAYGEEATGESWAVGYYFDGDTISETVTATPHKSCKKKKGKKGKKCTTVWRAQSTGFRRDRSRSSARKHEPRSGTGTNSCTQCTSSCSVVSTVQKPILTLGCGIASVVTCGPNIFGCAPGIFTVCKSVVDLLPNSSGGTDCSSVCSEAGNCGSCQPTSCPDGQVFDTNLCRCVCSDSGRILLPVPAGTSVSIVNGYNYPLVSDASKCPDPGSNRHDHCLNQKYGLDLTADNHTLLAPAAGRVAYVTQLQNGNECIGLNLKNENGNVTNIDLMICELAPSTRKKIVGDSVEPGDCLGEWADHVHLHIDSSLAGSGNRSATAYPFMCKYSLQGHDLIPDDTEENQQFPSFFPMTSENDGSCQETCTGEWTCEDGGPVCGSDEDGDCLCDRTPSGAAVCDKEGPRVCPTDGQCSGCPAGYNCVKNGCCDNAARIDCYPPCGASGFAAAKSSGQRGRGRARPRR